MKKIFLILPILFLFFLNCTEKEIDKYEDDPRLYFYRVDDSDRSGSDYKQRDSLVHTFFDLSDETLIDTVWIDVRTMGFPKEYDRPVSIIQTNRDDRDAAKEGVHYIAFDDEQVKDLMTMPAGKISAMIPIILLKESLPNDNKVRIKMTIKANEYFGVGVETNTSFIVTTTKLAEKPANWDTLWYYYFGEWGSRKMWFLIYYVNVNFDEDNPSYDYLTFIVGYAKNKLDAYEKENGELLEDDDTPVKF